MATGLPVRKDALQDPPSRCGPVAKLPVGTPTALPGFSQLPRPPE